MSGHNKWQQIRHKKGTSDQQRGQLFSKLARAITLAARQGGINPTNNPALQAAIERARQFDLPKENIERAVKRASEQAGAALEAVLIQAIGPGGVAIVVRAITDNKNRTIAEVKNILAQNDAKLVPPSSLNWQFDRQWRPTAPLAVTAPAAKQKLEKLFAALDDHADVEEIYSNLRD